MPAPEVELRTAWHQLAGREHEHLLQQLLAGYGEPHRRYHTATHVMWVLRHVADIAHGGEPPSDPAAVQLAALYHDVVYDPTAHDNERRSAAMAVQAAAALGWSGTRTMSVERLVLATAGHVPNDHDEAVLIDADLAVLGADPGDYAAYAQAVRAEYAHVADDAWRAGRAAVLREFLSRPQLFSTATMRTTREARARANLTAELSAVSD